MASGEVMKHVSLLFAVGALAVGVLAGPGWSAPNVRMTSCGRIAGPVVHYRGQTLSHYVVGTFHGVACAFARSWAAKIVHESTPNGSLVMPKGPAADLDVRAQQVTGAACGNAPALGVDSRPGFVDERVGQRVPKPGLEAPRSPATFGDEQPVDGRLQGAPGCRPAPRTRRSGDRRQPGTFMTSRQPLLAPASVRAASERRS